METNSHIHQALRDVGWSSDDTHFGKETTLYFGEQKNGADSHLAIVDRYGVCILKLDPWGGTGLGHTQWGSLLVDVESIDVLYRRINLILDRQHRSPLTPPSLEACTL